MAKEHPNVQIISRAGRPGLYLRCTCQGRTWEVNAGKDPKAAYRQALRISENIQEVKAGRLDLNDLRAESKQKAPIRMLLEEWKKDLSNRGTTEKHQNTQFQRASDLLKAAEVTKINDAAAERIKKTLVKMREANTSAQTLKAYKQAVNQFEGWLFDQRHIKTKHIGRVIKTIRTNVAADRRHRRRVWTKEEFAKLMAYLDGSQADVDENFRTGRYKTARNRLYPKDRKMLYQLAMTTMLRANELKSLSTHSLKLTGKKPHIVLAAEDEKARRGAHISIDPALAKVIAAWLGDREGKLFPAMPMPPAKILKRDLKAAKLTYKTPDGLLDFHSFRHSGGAWLVAAGVPIQVVRVMMRHSTIKLTLDTYGHLMAGDEESGAEKAYEMVRNCSPIRSLVTPHGCEQTRTDANTGEHSNQGGEGVKQ